MRLVAALLVIIIMVCGGLKITESGITEISGLDVPAGAFNLTYSENCVSITFAGTEHKIDLIKSIRRFFPESGSAGSTK